MLTSLVKFFLDPFNWLWILPLVSVIAWYLEKKWLRCSIMFHYVTGILFIASSTPLLPGLLTNSLERQCEPVYMHDFPDSSETYYIVVLGGGHSLDDRLPANGLLSFDALGRLNEGIRLHRKLANSELVF